MTAAHRTYVSGVQAPPEVPAEPSLKVKVVADCSQLTPDHVKAPVTCGSTAVMPSWNAPAASAEGRY